MTDHTQDCTGANPIEFKVKPDYEQLERVADEIHKLLLESQTSIGGDWRTRRDATLASYAKWKGMK